MAKTNVGLVNYAKAMIGKPYWYGTFGQTATAALHKSKSAQYPARYNASSYNQGWTHQYGQRVHDCVGLIKGYLWSDSTTSAPKYNSAQDVSANGMLQKCKTKGKINTIPEVAGVLVFFDGHVGVYEGNGYVLEARGHDYGVVRTKLSNRPWINWGYCPYITYISNSAQSDTNTTTNTEKTIEQYAKEVIAGKYGAGHDVRKKSLKLAGCPYDYEKIRAEVNKQLKENGNTTNVSYFPKYTGSSSSVVDALKSMGITSSFTYRKQIASANGIKIYTGISTQNIKLLSLLKQGKLIKP